MIQFFIENQEVVLPDDFSFTQIDENPIITGLGEFTLDITFSLLHPINAKAFKYINRINKIDIDVKYNSKIIDFFSSKFGSVIITGFTDKDVVVQFLSGNSELNYNATEDTRKIWDLDWGSEDAIDYTRALESIQNPGYYYHEEWGNPPVITKRYFVCAPVKVGSDIANEFLLSDAFIDNSTSPATLTPPKIYGVNNIVMQPYLMYYIAKLPLLLGYSLGTNCLVNDVRANNIYLINSVRSLKYGDALPDMTIGEFIDEIEHFFNVVFEVDKTTKKINIVSLNNFVQNLPRKKLKNVFDEFEVEPKTDEAANRLGWTKLSFSLSGSGLQKYQFLNEDIVRKMQIENFASENDLLAHSYPLGDLNKFKLYRDNEKNRDYIYCREPVEMIYHNRAILPGVNLYYVNKLAAYGDGTNELTLKLVPAEIIKGDLKVTVNAAGGSGGGGYSSAQYDFVYQLPKSLLSKIVDVETQNLIDAIENDLYSIERSDKISVALYMNSINLLYALSDWDLLKNIKYPFSYIDVVPEYGYEKKLPLSSEEDNSRWARWQAWVTGQFSSNAKTTLRLNGNQGILADYHTESKLDLSKIYYFTFPDTVDITTKNKFDYKNQIYIAIKFERVKSRNIGTVKGSFYRML